MKQLGFFIAASLLFHFMVSTTTLYWAEKINWEIRQKEPTVLELLTDEQKNERLERTRQLIKQLKASVDELKESRSRARFESEKNQRVEVETKAALLGLTQNSAAAALAKQVEQPNHQKNSNPKKEAERFTSKDTLALAQKNEAGDVLTQARRNSPGGAAQVSIPSSISVQLPHDIRTSNATNLNTDASTYYSFYSRIEELFYVRWVERNNYHWNRISYDYKKNTLAGKIWSTEIEVWLTAEGRYHSSYIKKSSGYQPFDEATVYAFKTSQLFPNPPKSKVEADGFVRLRYRFNVHVATY